jgi:hypothetical protein
MTKYIKNQTMKNKDLLKKYLIPISSLPQDVAKWNTFIKLSETATLIWYPNVGRDFDNIDLTSIGEVINNSCSRHFIYH